MARKAVFDHVEDNGAIILAIGDEQVELEDSDAFEQGLMSSKQIKAEARTDALPPETEGLPISEIQNMVRAGIAPDDIAKRFSLDSALVRRFGEPIEQEKKSAIAQFLTVNVRQNDEIHRLGELIHTLLAQAGVDSDSVEWSATRNRREPWRIIAEFEHNGRSYKATWTWNMRDNAVVAIDPTAKKLLGQSDTAAQDLLFGDDEASSISTDVRQSGPNPPSWMISGSDQQEHHDVDADGAVPAADSSAGPGTADRSDDTRLIDENARPALDPADDHTTALSPVNDAQTAEGKADGTEKARASQEAGPSAGASEHTSAKSAAGKKNSRRAARSGKRESKKAEGKESRRNAIPSWDDIIFGQ